MNQSFFFSLKQKIKFYLTDYARGGEAYKRLIIYFKNRRPGVKLKFQYLCPLLEETSLEQLAPKQTFDSIGPRTITEAPKSTFVDIPALQLFSFDNGLVHAKSNCIAIGNKLVFERYNENDQFSQGFVQWHDNQYAIIKEYPEVEIDNGFFLSGLGSWNWYHWLIEILPKGVSLDQIPTKNILVSDSVLKYPSMLNSLRAVIGDDYNIVYMNKLKNYRVKNLYHMNAISHVPFQLGSKDRLRVQDVFIRGDILLRIKEKLICAVGESSKATIRERVFLERENHRVASNQDELYEELKKLGFIKCRPDRLTLKEQIDLYTNAECVIGTSGAAFTNLMFSKRGSKFICFMAERYREFSCFSNLANNFGVELTYVYYKLDNNKSHASNEFRIDINQVLDTTKRVLNYSI